MTCGELIEILELFDSDTNVMVSMDGVACKDVIGADYVRNVRKNGPAHECIVENDFVAIMTERCGC